MTKGEKSLREKVASLVAMKAHYVEEKCFSCGGGTALGRATTTIRGEKIVSCWREECLLALQRRIGGAYAPEN